MSNLATKAISLRVEYSEVIEEEKSNYLKRHTSTPHDEAFKKLLQTFFAEFIALFFPQLDELLDHSQTRFLMQELLVDIVGEEARTLDLLLETRYKHLDAYVLVHLEPQSYNDTSFNERMFIYYSRLFERHRKKHKMIIPVVIFTYDAVGEGTDTLSIGIPGHDILKFQYLKVELKRQDWRRFIDSDNPVAAALLTQMKYNEGERRQVRTAFLRMILRLQHKYDDARLALIMSVADLYFQPQMEEDAEILLELKREYPEEGAAIMELMPAWKRWGIEEGLEQGLEQGRLEAYHSISLKLHAKGFSHTEIADMLGLAVEEINKLINN